MKPTLYLGEIWHVTRAPAGDAELQSFRGGALAVDTRGKVLAVGTRRDVEARIPDATVVDFGNDLILPGFVDAHVHFPQMDMIGMAGETLLGWLERYTYPEEARYKDRAVAEEAAERFVTELLANGTTLAAIYASSHRASAEALLSTCDARGIRAIVGKVSMDRGAPAGLLSMAAADQKDNEALIAQWHGKDGRLFVALTPRFALSCSDELLASLGAMKKRHPTVFVQTHFAETLDELAAVKQAFPRDATYLSVYERHGLIGDRTILGHGIHATDPEIATLAKSRTVLAHCPTSNLFLGSGLFPMDRMKEAGVRTALATDVGGGTSLSMWRTMDEAYKVQKLRGLAVSPVALLDLATLAGAEALGQGAVAGNFVTGKDADFQVVAPWRSRLLAERIAASATQRLAALMALGDDRLTRAVYVRGRRVYSEGLA